MEHNPPETGLMYEALKRVKTGKLLLIPASDETRGHAATGMAKFYKKELAEFLAAVPKRGDVGKWQANRYRGRGCELCSRLARRE